MSVMMIPQPSGVILPRCGVCGRDVFSKDVLTDMRLRNHPQYGLDVTPVATEQALIGYGLRRDNITCSSCLQSTAFNNP